MVSRLAKPPKREANRPARERAAGILPTDQTPRPADLEIGAPALCLRTFAPPLFNQVDQVRGCQQGVPRYTPRIRSEQ